MSWNDVSGLVWLLAIGGLVYWMMRRGGCGMHAGHSSGGHGGGGHGGGHGHGAGPAEPREHGSRPTRDPVCGMTVDPARAAATRTVGGIAFHLCSLACLEKFEADPEGYARRAAEAEKGAADHGRGGRRGC